MFKKIKKSVAVFAALLLMSSNSNAITEAESSANDCHTAASIFSNNYCCENYGEDYTDEQYNRVVSLYIAFVCAVQ